MKLQTKFILFIALLNAITLVLSFFIFEQYKLLFILSEVFIIISIVLSWQFYNQLIQPLKTLMTGIESLKERDFNIKFRPTGKYEMDQLITVYNEMADQLRVERTKQEQQHFFLEKLIYTSPTGIIILDFDNRIEQINPRALRILNTDEKELKGHYIGELTHPILQHIQSLTAGDSKTITPSGTHTYKLQMSHFIDRGFSRNFVMIEELTAEILAAEKKAYGKVIRMMAHEVNNTIGAVNSILHSTLKTKTFWENTAQATFQDAFQVAVARNDNLNVFMRNFADLVKLPLPVRKKIELNKTLSDLSRLMSQKAQEKEIEFRFDFKDPVFFISADEQQMEQVLINIVKNAIEAIDGKGLITFYTNASSKSLIIADSGKGIPSDANDKLFSPFFSTKKDGQGIGLTLVREILSNHNFNFALHTKAPNETEFVIQF